jgi:glycosyltransferase involved in cell wall biosynthesis
VPAIQNFNGSDFSVRIPIPFYLNQAIDKFGPDLVHSHHPFLMGDAAFRAARKRSLPLVYTHHTRFEQYMHYVPLDSIALKNFVVELATLFANLSSQVVAPSESIAEVLEENGVSRPVEAIPTGVDVPYGENGRLLPQDAPVEGFAAAIEKFKANPNLARSWISATARTAERFSREACAEKLEALYEKTLDRHGQMAHEKNDGQLLGTLETVAERIRAEWELLSLKAAAAIEAFKPDAD